MKKLDNLSIRKKVVTISMSASAIVLVITAVLIITIDYMRARRESAKNLSTLSSLLAYNAGAAIAFEDRETAQQVMESVAELPSIIEATITLPTGEQFASHLSSDPLHKQIISENPIEYESISRQIDNVSGDDIRLVTFSATHLDYAAPIHFEEIPVGLLTVRSSLHALHARVYSSFIVVALSLVVSLGLVYLLSNWLQKSVTLPIIRLTKAFSDLSQKKDYSIRVPRTTDDEVGELTTGFNSMLEILAQRESDMETLVYELEQATDKKSAFLANMSHEIRTPMNGILGITELLLDNPVSEEQKKYYQTISQSASALLHIVNDILDLSKIEAGKFQFELSNFDLNQVVLNISELFQPMADTKNISYSVTVKEGTPNLLRGDAGRIRQVLINLTGNAFKFTEEGSIAIVVSASHTTRSTAHLVFEVCDTGIGISENSQRDVFMEFVQIDDSPNRKFGGSGLGLSLSAAIVSSMEGEIGLESTEGVGSKFWFALTLQRQNFYQSQKFLSADIHATSASEQIHVNDDLAIAKYRANVLVVDDSEVNRFIMIETLKKFGIDTQSVSNGKEALDSCIHDNFDLIIMDIQMPGMDGLEATRRIRLWEATQHRKYSMPIVAYSASAMKGDKERFIEAGMDDYLGKPMELNALAIILEKWLVNYRDTKQ